MLALLAAVAAGVTIGGVIGAIATGDPRYVIAWSFALPISIVAAVFAGLRSASRSFRETGRAGASAAASPAGDPALARVERMQRRTAASGAPSPVDLELTVAPLDRAAYATSLRATVAPSDLDDLQPGSIIVVRRPDAAAPGVVLDLAPQPDWARLRDAERLRSGSERTVPLAADAPRWSDPADGGGTSPGSGTGGGTGGGTGARTGRPASGSGTPPASVAASRSGAPRPWRTALLALVVVAAAVAVLVPAFDSIGRLTRAVASGDLSTAGVVLGDRHREIVDALALETGGTEFVRIGFYADYALASAPSSPGALTIDGYEYRWDRTSHGDPEPIQPEDPAAALFDVDDVDFSRIPEFIDTAQQVAGIADPDSVIVSVERSPVADDSGERRIRVLVLLGAPYEDAAVLIDPATGEPMD
ncbi:hypothetical protein [Agromyces sp. ZXT2-3]|uniref:hypothetical protein n=1 Tax=Agromyces sp. ZXT2-3 TaxID=3461152 RepID=UPI0040552CA4